MLQLRQPSSLEVSTVDAASQQLTDAQRAFADVVGRELARIWIDGQTVTPTTNHQDASHGVSHEKS